MKAGLFVPCYIDQFYPGVARAALELLEKSGVDVVVPKGYTCCGQPLANSGFECDAEKVMMQLAEAFDGCDRIVAPSGSCTYHIRHHFDTVEQTAPVRRLRERTQELCEFLTSTPGLVPVSARFPCRAGLHQSCHGQRGLRLSSSTERIEPPFSVVEQLLRKVDGLELMPLDRTDECCGFGGTFSVAEEAVSVRMGRDRLQDHLRNGVEVITGTDISCLMHLDGLIRRNRWPLRVLHVAEILNGNGSEQ